MEKVTEETEANADAKEEIADIHQAIVKVKSEVQYILRDQKIQMGKGKGYTVATEAAYIEAVRPFEVLYGIYGYCVDIDPIRTNVQDVKTNYGTKSVIHHVCKYTYRMVHAPSGTSIDCVAMGESFGSDDKGLNKASTISAKYATMKVLYRLETGDDPDKYAGTFDSLVSPQSTRGSSNGEVDRLVSLCKKAMDGKKRPKIYEYLNKEPQPNQYGYTVSDWSRYLNYLEGGQSKGGNNNALR